MEAEEMEEAEEMGGKRLIGRKTIEARTEIFPELVVRFG
jgi:hypothetical protein